MLKKDGLYFEYLRKSREDRDAEAHGESETLARHERILDELAQKMGITVAKKYKEVVSGETIAARPQMMQMLEDIEELSPAGILVVEIERLARGDTRDQGLIMETFKYSGSKIITPMKIYDPNDEFDEEYAEFGLFMSRREYKTINRRLQRGRQQSQVEGKWTANKPPYGYEIVKIPQDKGYTLQVIQDNANVVRLIYELYLHGTLETNNIPVGTSKICRILDQMNIDSPGGSNWLPCTIRMILENPAYIGKIQAGRRKQVKKTVGGHISVSRPINKDTKIYNGLHASIIDVNTFYEVQEKRKSTYRKPFFEGVKNPLAGLIYCSECGKSMYRRPAGKRCPADMICCNTRNCYTSASYYSLIEDRLLQSLEEWLGEYRIRVSNFASDDCEVELNLMVSQRETALLNLEISQKQLTKAMDLLEKDIYSIEMFQQRATDLNEKIALNKKSISLLTSKIDALQMHGARSEEVISRFERVLTLYPQLSTGEEKNALLKEILNRIEYSKPHKGNRHNGGLDLFELKLFPKL